MHTNELPKHGKIVRIEEECQDVESFFISSKMEALPGQFILAWIPGMDAKPFCISSCDGSRFSVTVCKVGPFSEKIFEKKIGDTFSYFGPYGTSFSIPENQHLATVGGGYGAAALAWVAKEAKEKGCSVDFIVGARKKESILFAKKVKAAGMNVIITTDDGSAGLKGRTTDALADLIKNSRPDVVMTVGPEMMMYYVAKMCQEQNIPCEISMERYMKCGFGVCGQCCVDDLGIRMCKEGPVISGDLALQIKEFGKYHRDRQGRKVMYG
ncbi:dihydroorotate dehydrogenase electron transfer subunit [Candidatus Woesearchaeota archaeon]|nr:MAG: dihydroorotate dehydrogenase electron transfer subunit [archaeon GW2011_AR4]MBS3129083.1 dihydroorotate dehydrogenase electron transfer subunit [Candidatus Woesearchaeota archaeon]HIH37817.1 dihydroorotate dehydrogenase electron transfer subunit [Candidatus Woesearchaeota archaeon]HIH48409.1 dihydroorotate dehydrogenase electron transfer subunit [Candidatus Woesearchaeota archaeon]HIJ03942.1 dihydroorotate dehydrogenase electron transfer subunit [Candidatus Woesearchaeota archaeon]